MGRSDTTGARGRAAFIAALVGLAAVAALPVLPIYGDGHHFFWAGFPTRFIAAYLVGRWAPAVAILFGIGMLLRRRSAFAAGVFAAIALIAALGIAQLYVEGAVDLRSWQSAVAVGLQAIEAAALAVAASIGARRWS
jgi:hypothetical protein